MTAIAQGPPSCTPFIQLLNKSSRFEAIVTVQVIRAWPTKGRNWTLVLLDDRAKG